MAEKFPISRETISDVALLPPLTPEKEIVIVAYTQENNYHKFGDDSYKRCGISPIIYDLFKNPRIHKIEVVYETSIERI